MKKIQLLAVMLLPTLFIAAQSNSTGFPQNFIGTWKGSLTWTVAGKPSKSFSMELKVQPADSAHQYTWHIIYGDVKEDSRPYLLKPVDTVSGHWVIDEKDGIVLDSYVLGNCLQGAFTVLGNTVVDNYCIEEGKMTVEFFSIKLGDKKQSGKGTNEAPWVDSYRMAGYQKGVLIKAK